ncbi:MAG: phosphodiester glycosidase family protein [Bacillota bacterium]|nr:phosphodiester glycosidase family protein [Bacillota bacterium]
MKHMRKLIAVVMTAVMIFLLACNTALADSSIIHETRTSEAITSGVTHESINRFTDNGWVNINVLRVDLSNPYIKLDTMTSPNSIKALSSVKSMAQNNGAVAAVNGGFFNWLGDSTAGYPDGPIVQNGQIITASNDYNRYNDSMATFSINNLNQVLFDYWKTDITLMAPNGQMKVINQYDKFSNSNFTDFTIFDRRWNGSSVGASASMPDVVEMVVDQGKVVDIRQGQPQTQIPQNGYVVVTRKTGGQFIIQNFQIGDEVTLDISTSPVWSDMKMAVTGSAILVRDGQIPSTFSFNIPGLQPRTAVGSSKDGKQLILVTVDGRQNSSIGMSQYQLAQLMLDLGAYNAMNLDGGGSTTMVERTPGTNSLSLVNSPSDGYQRGVSTAIGIFSIAPPSDLAGVVIDTNDSNVFVNTTRKFTVRGYDKYLNPISIDPSTVKWSVSGIQGSFSGSTLTAKSVGTGKVTVSIGNISSQIDINSLSAPVQLSLSDKSLKMANGGTHTITLTAKNKSGYTAEIYPSDVNWSVKGNVGVITKGTFTATANGTGYIDASVGNTHAYCAVSIAVEKSTVKDSFVAANGTFLSYPATVGGSYTISGEQQHSGNTSGKLTYDFTNTNGTRAAYMVLPNNGMKLDSNTTKLGLWVYNTHPTSNWLSAEVYDSNNKSHSVYFTKNMDWTGWKYVEVSLSGISSPARLTRLYLAQVSPVSDSGSIYLDDLSATTSSFPAVSNLPQDTGYKDDANKSTAVYTPSSDSFRFAVFGQSRDPKNAFENTLLSGLASKINNYLDAAAVVGNNKHDFTKLIKTPFVSTNTGYKSVDYKNSSLIQLDMSNNGLRAASTEQWHWLQQKLSAVNSSNVFLFLGNTPSSFSDSQEAKLFKQTLSDFQQQTGKNVWVFYKGSSNTSYMDSGIKYISVAGLDSSAPLSTASSLKYMLVTVKGSTVTYEYKPVQ